MKYIPVIGCIWWLRKYPKSKVSRMRCEQIDEATNDGWIAALSTLGFIFLVTCFVLLFFMAMMM